MSIISVILDPVISDFVLPVVGAAVATGIAWVAAKANAKLGVDIEAKHREALHSAIMTGIRLALSKGHIGNAAIREAQEYAKRSVPGAIGKLKPSREILSDLAAAKLQEVMRNVLTRQK